MIVTVHQPDFLPWLGFFDRWQKSDLFIILDDVQFIRRGWQHRDKIKTPQGIKWLTVPVIKKGRYLQEIRDVEINNQEDWTSRLLNTIQVAYSKAPNFNFVFDNIQDILFRKHKLLIDLNMELLKYCSNMLEINTPIKYSSSFSTTSKGTDRLVELVQSSTGNIYLSGLGAKDYLNEEAFSKENIEVVWQKFYHPIYRQLYGKFDEMLSVIDFLMMVSNTRIAFSV